MKTAYQHPTQRRQVVLTDGYVIDRQEAERKGFRVVACQQHEKVAAPHPHREGLVVLPGGLVETASTARMCGYRIAGHAASVEAVSPSPERAWRTAIMKLPEANGRESAVAEMVAGQTPESLSIESARAFLRGLPKEKPEAKAPPTMTTNNDPRSARRDEIAGSMSAFNKSQGYDGDRRAKPAQALSAVDPVRLKRLAEIRLGALTLRMERGETVVSHEHKNLSYAMNVHSQTGMPLATIFTQMGVDTSKMLSEESAR
jgi:hypothetical protein